jgi:hypothetical protein
MTLVDGGGGARKYTAAGTGRWAALNVDRPDTIVQSGTSYVRKLRGGSQVVFNSLGQHITTRNPQGDSTRFTYSSGRLCQILLPAPSTSPQYTFTYTSSYLTSVTAPGSRITVIGRSGAVVTSIQDPSSAAVTLPTRVSLRRKIRLGWLAGSTCMGSRVGPRLHTRIPSVWHRVRRTAGRVTLLIWALVSYPLRALCRMHRRCLQAAV